MLQLFFLSSSKKTDIHKKRLKKASRKAIERRKRRRGRAVGVA